MGMMSGIEPQQPELLSADGKLGPDAYKKLYPAEFYRKFVENGIRPDGRSFGSGRPVTIGLKPIEGPSSSALVKIGSTSVLAGLTFEVHTPFPIF